MVHLAAVSNDKTVSEKDVAVAVQELDINGKDLGVPGEDEYTSNVYGSRFAATDLPKHEMPEDEMPREVAYRMIKDDLTLDGVPTLKYVLFAAGAEFQADHTR
jgi:glutamate decarboxylase